MERVGLQRGSLLLSMNGNPSSPFFPTLSSPWQEWGVDGVPCYSLMMMEFQAPYENFHPPPLRTLELEHGEKKIFVSEIQ